MLHRNGKEVKQLLRNGKETVTLYKNGVIIYNSSSTEPVQKVFQDLIDEGYVTIGNSQPSGRATTLTVSADCPYSISQISDFYDVFDSIKMVSSNGVVGDGELPNAFLWPTNHWLTNAEVYTLYNGRTLSHDLIGLQFRYLDWTDFNSVTIKYRDGSSQWDYTDSPIFGGSMPKTINFDINNRRISSLHWMFGRMPDNSPMSNTETLNFITANSTPMQVRRNVNGAFEGAASLKTITGLQLDSIDLVSAEMKDTFSGCTSLQTIPIDLAPNGFHQTNFTNTFKNCFNLEEITPIIYANGINYNTDTFKNCYKLQVLYLNGINALTNEDIDLSTTIINTNSISYIVDHITTVDTTVSGFEYKNIKLPSSANITSEQISTLYQNGWNCYVGDNLMQV